MLNIMKKKKICIVGLGYVGLTLAMHSVRNGYEVHGIEILDDTFDIISSGSTHFYEPGLNELLKISLGTSFHVHKNIPNKVNFDVFIVTVGTPLLTGQKTPNIEVLYNAVESIAPFVSEDNLVILRSTIPVGTSRLVAEKILKSQNLNSVNVSFCPERTAEGQALVELQSLPQIISGNSDKSACQAREFFETLADEVVEANSLEEAELIKLFNNTFRDASFAIANTFNQIAQSFSVDGAAVINKANYKYARSAIPKPGFVAGPCLEKDAHILSSGMPDGDLKNFISSIRNANENLEKMVADYISKYLQQNKASKVLLTGIAFKGLPQTNDLRGSSALNIVTGLAKHAANLTVHDFMNSKEELAKQVDLKSVGPDEIFNNSVIRYDCIVILNNHPKYKSLQMMDFISKQIQKGAFVIDSWGVMGLSNQLTLTNLFIGGN